MLEGLRTLTRNAHLWLPGYLRSRWQRRREGPPAHAWIVVADHFEPFWRQPDLRTARERVAPWRRQWPQIAERHLDDTGRCPRYTFFYPEEEYREEFLEALAEMAAAGCADVEVHIHHDGGGVQEFLDRMSGFLDRLHRRHGLLRRQGERIVFGFIHGNWALDNARPDGRHCGLNNELSLLSDLGCYADFTLPAVPDPSQAGPVNVIFRATDDPLRPRSHAQGRAVVPGCPAVGHLTLIPGPLGLYRSARRPWKPRTETGEIAWYHPPSIERAHRWLALAPRIGGHCFLKLFTHGAQERNAGALLNGELDLLFSSLRAACHQGGTALHYVSAWEMWRAVEALRLRDDPLRVLESASPVQPLCERSPAPLRGS